MCFNSSVRRLQLILDATAGTTQSSLLFPNACGSIFDGNFLPKTAPTVETFELPLLTAAHSFFWQGVVLLFFSA